MNTQPNMEEVIDIVQVRDDGKISIYYCPQFAVSGTILHIAYCVEKKLNHKNWYLAVITTAEYRLNSIVGAYESITP